MSRLNQGQELSPGQSLYSPNRKYRLIYQSDGNLVLYRNADEFALWSTKTHGQSAGKLISKLMVTWSYIMPDSAHYGHLSKGGIFLTRPVACI